RRPARQLARLRLQGAVGEADAGVRGAGRWRRKSHGSGDGTTDRCSTHRKHIKLVWIEIFGCIPLGRFAASAGWWKSGLEAGGCPQNALSEGQESRGPVGEGQCRSG